MGRQHRCGVVALDKEEIEPKVLLLVWLHLVCLWRGKLSCRGDKWSVKPTGHGLRPRWRCPRSAGCVNGSHWELRMKISRNSPFGTISLFSEPHAVNIVINTNCWFLAKTKQNKNCPAIQQILAFKYFYSIWVLVGNNSKIFTFNYWYSFLSLDFNLFHNVRLPTLQPCCILLL